MGLFNKKQQGIDEAEAENRLQGEVDTLRAVLRFYKPGTRIQFGSPTRCPHCGDYGFVNSVNKNRGVSHNHCFGCQGEWVITLQALQHLENATPAPTPTAPILWDPLDDGEDLGRQADISRGHDHGRADPRPEDTRAAFAAEAAPRLSVASLVAAREAAKKKEPTPLRADPAAAAPLAPLAPSARTDRPEQSQRVERRGAPSGADIGADSGSRSDAAATSPDSTMLARLARPEPSSEAADPAAPAAPAALPSRGQTGPSAPASSSPSDAARPATPAARTPPPVPAAGDTDKDEPLDRFARPTPADHTPQRTMFPAARKTDATPPARSAAAPADAAPTPAKPPLASRPVAEAPAAAAPAPTAPATAAPAPKPPAGPSLWSKPAKPNLDEAAIADRPRSAQPANALVPEVPAPEPTPATTSTRTDRPAASEPAPGTPSAPAPIAPAVSAPIAPAPSTPAPSKPAPVAPAASAPPVATPAPPAEIAAEPILLDAPRPPPPAPAEEGPLRVLVVEDNPFDLALLEEVVDASDDVIHLVSATTRNEAERIAALATFDIVLLGLDLPDSAGIPTLLEWQHSAVSAAPVIVLIGHSEASVIREAKALGALHVVQKTQLADLADAGPVGAERLIRLLRSTVKKHASLPT